jgi:sarcosine oxidase
VSGAQRLEPGLLVADARADVADIAIVGLGAMGALSAWRLAARGARVIGFEQFRPGHDRGSSHGESRIFRTAYFESPEYVPLLQRAHELWRQLEEETGAQLLTMTGGLAIGPPDGELVAGVLASARENQLPHRLLDSSEMTRLYPQHRLDASEVAVLDEQAGFLRPERSVAAAASRAEALGARLLAETQVTSIKASSGGVVIETSRGRFAAERALVTAGPWTSKLLPQLGLPLQVERQLMAWMAVDDPASFAPHRFPIFIREVAEGRFRYGFPSTDGRSIKLAVHHEGTDADPDSVDREVGDADLLPIRDFAREHLHGVTSEVVKARVCMYTNTPDERFIAASPAGMPDVTVLSACSGHGFKFAAVMGELMAELILDARALPAIVRTA